MSRCSAVDMVWSNRAWAPPATHYKIDTNDPAEAFFVSLVTGG